MLSCPRAGVRDLRGKHLVKTVFAYVRVSGKGQVDGDGPERQKDLIDRFCVAHNLALPLANIFFEPGVSGTVSGLDRPAFTQMLLAIERAQMGGQEVEGIVVERLDRLARDLMVSELLMAECRKRKLAIYSADQGMLIDMASNGDDPTRKLIRQLMGALAEWEKSMLVKKLRMSRERKRQETGRCEGRKPFGSRPGEQPCLDTMAHLINLGTPVDKIAAELNSVGFTTRNGHLWSVKHVRKQLVSKGIIKSL